MFVPGTAPFIRMRTEGLRPLHNRGERAKPPNALSSYYIRRLHTRPSFRAGAREGLGERYIASTYTRTPGPAPKILNAYIVGGTSTPPAWRSVRIETRLELCLGTREQSSFQLEALYVFSIPTNHPAFCLISSKNGADPSQKSPIPTFL